MSVRAGAGKNVSGSLASELTSGVGVGVTTEDVCSGRGGDEGLDVDVDVGVCTEMDVKAGELACSMAELMFRLGPQLGFQNPP